MSVKIVTGFTRTNNVTADDDRARIYSIFGTTNAVLPYGNMFEAEKIDNNTVRVRSGMGIMQGTQMGIPLDDVVDVPIENGKSGVTRKDLIAMRYQKDNNTGVESVSMIAIKGSTTAPYPTTGNIVDGGALVCDFPLHIVTIESTTLTKIESVFQKIEAGAIRKVNGIFDTDNPTPVEKAKSLNSAVGSVTQPIYLNASGVPQACNTLGTASQRNYASALSDTNQSNLASIALVKEAVGSGGGSGVTIEEGMCNLSAPPEGTFSFSFSVTNYTKIGNLVILRTAITSTAGTSQSVGVSLESGSGFPFPLVDLIAVNFLQPYKQNSKNCGFAHTRTSSGKRYLTSQSSFEMSTTYDAVWMTIMYYTSV